MHDVIRQEDPYNFEVPITSGGRIVGTISGTIEVDETGAMVTDEADIILQQFDPDAGLLNSTAAPFLNFPVGGM